MKKFLLITYLFIFLSFAAQSQTFWEENFDSYNAGEYICEQSSDWETWSGNGTGTAEDIFVVSAQANSGSNSLECIGGGSADVIVPLGNIGEGEYTVDLSIYVPAGNGAYYNFQEDATPAVGWAFECYFSQDGTWEMIMDQFQVATGNFSHDSWFRMSHVIDLANNIIAIYQDDAPQGSFTFDSPLGGINIYPAAPTGQSAFYYVDDIYVYKSKEDFDDYASGSALGNVSQQWSTWSGTGGGTEEDGLASNAFAYNGFNSGFMSGNTCDPIYPMGNFSAGSWEISMKIYTPSGSGGYMSIQHDEDPGLSLADQLFFGGNSGVLDAGGASAATFSWSDDTWHDVTRVIDIDNDMATLFIDGNSVYTWTFSDEATSSGMGQAIIGSANFKPGAVLNNLNPEFYVDNFTFRRTSLMTSITSQETKYEELTLFPNPTSSVAFIQNTLNEDVVADIRIYDSVGKLVEQRYTYFEVSDIVEINTTSWNSGLYFIEFIAKNNRKTLKLVVE